LYQFVLLRRLQMNHRVPASTLIAAAAVALLAASAFAQAPAAAVKTPAASSAAIPRTADGHPDLSGVFTNVTTVPMARPANCGTKEFYTAEDIAAGMGGARGCSKPGDAPVGRGGRGGAPAGGRGAAANIDPETGQPALAVHYDTSQFGLSGNTIPKSTSMRTSIITGPDGKIPPLTPEAQKRQQERAAYNRVHQWDGPESRPLGERCIMWPAEGPPMLSEGYNSDVQIVQSAGYVAVLQEMIHDTRLIPTNGGPSLLPSNIHQWLGSARGHWEGDKLVVETTNFSDKTTLQQAPTTDKLKVTEKFSRIDANNVLYEFTVDDPSTWTKPWSGEVTWVKIDSPIYEYACHEGNYGMANNLSGARATEKKAAEQK
jgi:hypothetical protein